MFVMNFSDTHSAVRRSARYPFIGLQEAVGRLAQVESWEQERSRRDHAFAHEDLLDAWRPISRTSSAFAQRIAAMHQYGLFRRIAYEVGHLELTDVALRILYTEADSADYASALKEAALNPKIFREMIALAERDADQHGLIDYLITDRKEKGEAPFTRKAAENLLRIFDETMSFAGIRTAPVRDEPWTTEHLTDEDGWPIQIRYKGRASRKRYEFLRDFLDLKIRRLRESGPT